MEVDVFSQFNFRNPQGEIALLPRIVSQEGPGWLYVSSERFRMTVSLRLFVFQMIVLHEELLTYFLC